MMNKDEICKDMLEAVIAICNYSDEKDFLISMIAEIKRLFPFFSKAVSCPLLRGSEESYLRKIDECIDNFYFVYFPQVRRNKEIAESKEYKDFLSLLKMLKTAIKAYFMPPTFEPQQMEQKYTVLIENKTVISEVMGILPDSFSNKVNRWLDEYKKSAYVLASTNESDVEEIEQAKEDFKLKYGNYIKHTDSFFETLKTIKARPLKTIYENYNLAKVSGCMKFFDDCEKIVPWRKKTKERGWNRENFRRLDPLKSGKL